MVTAYIVQSFQLKGRKLVADPPQPKKTAAAAIDLAERLGPSRSGVAAFSQEVDIETDCYDEPRLLFSTGDLPQGFLER
jgi:hypothetical protein